jgi:hypothetical protein
MENQRHTAEQGKAIRAVMLAAAHKEDELRSLVHPDHADIEARKERIRKEEDEEIMKLLSDAQRVTFTEMISNRRRK